MSSSLYCYWVNSSTSSGTGTPLDAASCHYANAVCAAPNNPNSFVFYAWAFNNSGIYDVDYKFPLPAYDFRQSTSSVKNIQEHGWQVYPNPATNELIVNNMGSTDAANEYYVIDMAGRMLQR